MNAGFGKPTLDDAVVFGQPGLSWETRSQNEQTEHPTKEASCSLCKAEGEALLNAEQGKRGISQAVPQWALTV